MTPVSGRMTSLHSHYKGAEMEESQIPK